MKKRIIAMVLSVAMMLTMFPTGVLADDFIENTEGVTVSAEGQGNENQGEESDTAQLNVIEDEETQLETVQPENEQTEPEQTENDQTEPTQNETDQAKPEQTETDQTKQPEPGSTVPDQAGTQPDDKQPEPDQPATDPAENGVSDGAESTEGEQAESKTEFTVTWESEGETILTKTFAEGTSKDEVEDAQPAEDPVKEADGDVAYEFAGWTPDYADVTADQTYTATFEEAKPDEQDEMVSTANLVEPADINDQSVTLAVGDTETLTGSDEWNWGSNPGWSSSSDAVSITAKNGNEATVKANKVSSEPVTITHTYNWWGKHTDKWTITVTAPVAATGVVLKTQDGKTDEAEVTEFQTLKLVATPVPNNAKGTYQWHSDNDEILSVQGNGNEATVTGKVRNQSANITVQFTPTAGEVQQATIKIDVKPDEAHSRTAKALVYYLINPRGDVNSNNDELFGDRYGEVTVNTTGMVWNHNNGRNCTTSDVKNRVVDWPDGYKVVEPKSTHWYAIFNSYKATVGQELGVTITEDDVEEIRIIPAKISQNNGTNPDYHVDCNVQIVCKKVATVKYYLQDVGDTTPQFLGSKNYITGNETKPSDVTDKTFPGTQDQGDVTYTFKGWYTDPFFTNGPVSMPQTVNGSTDYYAKYVAGRSVTYDLDGGSWNLSNQNNWTEQVDEGFLYTVKGGESTRLQRTGYTFAGWKVDGESIDSKTEFNAGDKFTMPGRNVTLKAKWDKDATKTKDTQYIVKYTINGVEQSNDTIVVTGTAWVNDDPAMIAIAEGGIPAPANKYEGYKLDEQNPEYPAEGTEVKSGSEYTVNYVNRTDLSYTVHYYWKDTTDEVAPSKNVTDQTFGTTATEKPIEVNGYTAVNPEEEKTFSIGVTNEDVIFYYYKDVTVTADNKSKTYGDADPKLTATATGLVGEDTVDYTLSRKLGENVGEYAITVTGNEVQGNYKVSFADGKLVITPKNIVPGDNNKDLTATAPKDVVYNGESQQQKPIVKDGDKVLEEDTDYTLTYSEDTTNAGTVTVTITGKGNYDGKFEVTYEITPAPLKITTNSAEKTYDGSALTAGGKIEGLVKGETATLKTTGSQTEVGESKNTYEIEWGDATKASNYKIAEEDIGTLKVNARSGGGSSSKPTPEDEPTPTPTPTPLPTLPTTPAPTTPARRVTRSTATVTQPTSRPTEQITENETPKAESEPEVIEDEETPLAPMAGGAWALVNLILMLLTVLASLLLLLGYLGKKKYAKEDEYGNALHDANGNEIIDYTRNKKGFWRVASLIPAIAAVIAFALTENMRLPMVMTDRWTLLMVIIAVVQLIVAVLCKKKKESEEDENQANA